MPPPLILATMRQDFIGNYRELRDSIDNQWFSFLEKCGVHTIVVPNNLSAFRHIVSNLDFKAVLLTGGGNYSVDLTDTRSQIEHALLSHCIKSEKPVIGVCRGMQVIQQYFGVHLSAVEGHIQQKQEIQVSGKNRVVNSFHDMGTTTTCNELKVWAQSNDGVVKAVRHNEHPVTGIMWHPERMQEFSPIDIELFREHFFR